ncbi:glycosyltransferase family 4 protein [Knoellia locipacati]|uniref:glycosyltransferase family 4 protein n=1 Tax=Knoellia locipacati TaxID=882824 RepID=UPI0038510014
MPLRVVIFNWRDMHHPEAGGAEKYIVTVAEGLARRGHRITFCTSAYPGALPDEVVNGVHYVRRGGRFGIYPRALLSSVLSLHRPDVVIDVQNGMPYLTPLVSRYPVVNLVHHVHKEQWPVTFGPRTARAGWWVESRLAPKIYRNATYVAVSDSTRRELTTQGIDRERIVIIHNGTDATPLDDTPRSANPSLIVLGRLVPQKRVEYALEAVANLVGEMPDLTLDVVGSGWWEPHLRERVQLLGIEKHVTFHGHVSEAEKHRLLAGAWVHVMPSLKEGWGLVVVEAGIHGTPTVAFREAGGPNDSIVHNRTGILVEHGTQELTAAVRTLLVDGALRSRLSDEVARWVPQFHWDESVERWEQVLTAAVAH